MVANDTSHIVGTLDPNQIGEAIRHKKFGVDMREAIAQAFEFMQSWYKSVQELNSLVESLKQDINDLSAKHSQDIQNLQEEIDDEVGKRIEEVTELTAKIEKNESDINNLRIDFEQYATKVDKRFEEQNKRFDEQDKRLKKLEDAVFRAIYVNDTMQDIPDTPPDSHYINDTNAVDDDNGLIINDDSYTLPYDIN